MNDIKFEDGFGKILKSFSSRFSIEPIEEQLSQLPQQTLESMASFAGTTSTLLVKLGSPFVQEPLGSFVS